MKKNKMMRLASAMMVMTLMTTSVISGTFAKYVTSDDAQDTARVAKWGITVMASGNLFGTDYAEKTHLTTPDRIMAGTSESVSSSNSDNIVAPGTKNTEGFSIAISGTPEVKYTVEATDNGVTAEDIFLAAGEYGVMVKAVGLNAATDVTGYYTLSGTDYTAAIGDWDSGETYYELHDYANVATKYYPLVWSVTESGKAMSADITAVSDLANITSSMIAKFNDGTTFVGNAKESAAAQYSLAWEWPFYVSDDNDKADTILGNLMVGNSLEDGSKVVKKVGEKYSSELVDGTDYNLEVKFGLKVSVTQVD